MNTRSSWRLLVKCSIMSGCHGPVEGGMGGVEAGEIGGAASLSHRLGKCSNLYLMRSSGALTFACGAVFG